MTVRSIPGFGPTALNITTEKVVKVPSGAKIIQPEDSFCPEHGDVQIIAEFGRIDILSCGCEIDTRDLE